MMQFSSISRLFLLCGMIGLLVGCGGLLPKAKDAPRQYTLSGAGLPNTGDGTPMPYSLEIQRPTAAPGLESERIAHQTTPYRLEYLADARWASSAPSILQYALVESFTRRSALGAIGSDEAAMQADYGLALDLQEFQFSSVAGNPQGAKLRVIARVMSLPSRKVLKMQSFDATEPVEKQDMEALAGAFQNAYNRLAPQLLDFTLATIRLNPPVAQELPTVAVKKPRAR